MSGRVIVRLHTVPELLVGDLGTFQINHPTHAYFPSFPLTLVVSTDSGTPFVKHSHIHRRTLGLYLYIPIYIPIV